MLSGPASDFTLTWFISSATLNHVPRPGNGYGDTEPGTTRQFVAVAFEYFLRYWLRFEAA